MTPRRSSFDETLHAAFVPEQLGRWFGVYPALVSDVKDPDGLGRVKPWVRDAARFLSCLFDAPRLIGVGQRSRDSDHPRGLALDLMEELRPVLADRLALSLVNRGQVRAQDFIVEEAGGVRLTDAARKAVLVAWQERKRDELRHPFLGEAAPLGLVAHLQAQLLARHLRGDLDGYPGFLWR